MIREGRYGVILETASDREVSMRYARKPIKLMTTAGLLALLLAGCSGQTRDWELKDISDVFPALDFRLQQAPDGEIITEETYSDQIQILFFGFRNCPDICPSTLAKLSAAVEQLGSDTDEVKVLFVSVDPNRDTLPKLDQYVSSFSPQISGATASEERLRSLVKRYNVTFSYGDAYPDGEYVVTHSSAIIIFDRDGDARLLGMSDVPVEAITKDLRALVESG
ncbi:MAG: SCO family protein [Halofilum sp. (in: g-proteobacteria)]